MANYMAIKTMDINNGPGLRVSVWFSGCHFKCNGCHNKEAWDFNAGKEFTKETVSSILSLLDDEDIGLSILGGEPFHPNNVDALFNLVAETKAAYPDKSIWIWTGYKIESLVDRRDPKVDFIIDNINVIVDGLFDETLKINGLKYKGSSNQRVIPFTNKL